MTAGTARQRRPDRRNILKSYNQLTLKQRLRIAAGLKAGLSLTRIARTIGVNKSTVSRELRRNAGGRGYRPEQAQAQLQKRRVLSMGGPARPGRAASGDAQRGRPMT
ncbi:helix-turn-helix domain-containing protein [Nevskia soli]|uniref:helix-turn-helix domain-containing protein n=1 Tax=Nevskia soli TaxID=418856 RepID=UPI003F4FA95A